MHVAPDHQHLARVVDPVVARRTHHAVGVVEEVTERLPALEEQPVGNPAREGAVLVDDLLEHRGPLAQRRPGRRLGVRARDLGRVEIDRVLQRRQRSAGCRDGRVVGEVEHHRWCVRGCRVLEVVVDLENHQIPGGEAQAGSLRHDEGLGAGRPAGHQ